MSKKKLIEKRLDEVEELLSQTIAIQGKLIRIVDEYMKRDVRLDDLRDDMNFYTDKQLDYTNQRIDNIYEILSSRPPVGLKGETHAR